METKRTPPAVEEIRERLALDLLARETTPAAMADDSTYSAALTLIIALRAENERLQALNDDLMASMNNQADDLRTLRTLCGELANFQPSSAATVEAMLTNIKRALSERHADDARWFKINSAINQDIDRLGAALAKARKAGVIG